LGGSSFIYFTRNFLFVFLIVEPSTFSSSLARALLLSKPASVNREALRKSKEIADLRQKLLLDCEKAKFVLEEDLQDRLRKARLEISDLLDEQHKRTLRDKT
jgi:hypothetical protein